YYYEVLIKAELLRDRTPYTDMLMGFLSFLAFSLFCEDRADLGDLRMFEIAQKYQDQYDLRFDTNQVTDQSVQRGMLCGNSDGFAFQYKFVYLYSVAQYLARNMGRLDVRSHVDGLCARLELADHADIMLFLAHLTSDDYI